MHIAVMTNAPSKQLENYCFALGAEWFLDKADMSDAIARICDEVLRKKLTLVTAESTLELRLAH